MTEPYPLWSELIEITEDLGIKGKILWSGCVQPADKDSKIRSFLRWLKEKIL